MSGRPRDPHRAFFHRPPDFILSLSPLQPHSPRSDRMPTSGLALWSEAARLDAWTIDQARRRLTIDAHANLE